MESYCLEDFTNTIASPGYTKRACKDATLHRMASKSADLVSPFVLQPSKGGLWINEPGVTIRAFKSALKALSIRERRQ